MNYPRSEYDYGTAAIQLAFFTPAYGTESRASLLARAKVLARIERIERLHLLRQRIEITKAKRWVFKKYPQHFALMP